MLLTPFRGDKRSSDHASILSVFIVQVDVEIAKASNTIKTMIEDLGLDEDDDEPVPLPNVNGAIMRKVCSSFKHSYFLPSNCQPAFNVLKKFERITIPTKIV